MMHFRVALLLLLPIFTSPSNGECRFEDVVGVWNFFIGDVTPNSLPGSQIGLSCNKTDVSKYTNYTVELNYPNIAKDEFGNPGFWTLVDAHGIEVVIAGRKFIASFKIEAKGKIESSFCDQMETGETKNVAEHNWGCFSARKTTPVKPRNHVQPSFYEPPPKEVQLKAQMHFNSFYRSSLNADSTASIFNSYEDMIRMVGGRKSLTTWRPPSIEAPPKVKEAARWLPRTWDWRKAGKMRNVDYVGPAGNQKSCGSCFAFATLGMLEARLRILTKNHCQIQLSPQDVVECDHYNSGCEGGVPYVVGKYLEEVGATPEKYNSYKGGACKSKICPCSTPVNATRYFANNYQYVGGYYGGCSEEAMRISLVRNGPLVVTYKATDQFGNYYDNGFNGIWHCNSTTTRSSLPPYLQQYYPFEMSNHAVLLVGYGIDRYTKERYWIVRNSWGKNWGDGGFFRIARGTNECFIETGAMEAFPILS